MRRTTLTLVAILVAGLAAAPTGAAAEPTFDRPPPHPLPADAKLGPDGIYRHTMPVEPPFDVPAEESPCGFPLHVESVGKFIVKTFPSGRQRIFSPRPHEARQTVTNTANGKTVTVNVGGAATLTPLSGGRVREQAYGATVWPVFEHELSVVGGEARIIYFDRGSLVAEYRPEGEGDDLHYVVTSFAINAPARDLCEDIA